MRAPFLSVDFTDVFIADQLCSLVLWFNDLEFTTCFFLYDAWTDEDVCSLINPYITPFIGTQSWRCVKEDGLTVFLWQHLFLIHGDSCSASEDTKMAVTSGTWSMLENIFHPWWSSSSQLWESSFLIRPFWFSGYLHQFPSNNTMNTSSKEVLPKRVLFSDLLRSVEPCWAQVIHFIGIWGKIGEY